MDKKQLVDKYLEFKEECVNRGIFNIEEIKLLFEVWLKI